MSAIELVIDLPFLAGEVNDAHRQVTSHAKGMLLEAKRAGDALLAAKAKVRHGEFKAWVEGHCRCSYRSAAEYMQVARHAKNAEVRTFDGGVRAFLEAHAKPRPAEPLQFGVKDAERILKINDRVERGEGAERAVAASMLETVAAQYGMTSEAALERSRAMCPNRDKTRTETINDAGIAAAEERIAALEARMEQIIARRSVLLKKYEKLTKYELLEELVGMTLIAEGFA